jgi:hypothetical protein
VDEPGPHLPVKSVLRGKGPLGGGCAHGDCACALAAL